MEMKKQNWTIHILWGGIILVTTSFIALASTDRKEIKKEVLELKTHAGEVDELIAERGIILQGVERRLTNLEILAKEQITATHENTEALIRIETELKGK